MSKKPMPVMRAERCDTFSKSGVGATLPRVRIPPSPPSAYILCALRGFFYFYPHFYPRGVVFLCLIVGGEGYHVHSEY